MIKGQSCVGWCQGPKNLLVNWRGQITAKVGSFRVLTPSHLLHIWPWVWCTKLASSPNRNKL